MRLPVSAEMHREIRRIVDASLKTFRAALRSQSNKEQTSA
jgi:hypothetical protein